MWKATIYCPSQAVCKFHLQFHQVEYSAVVSGVTFFTSGFTMESINGDQPQIDRNEDEEWWETEDQENFDATSTAREAPSAENAAQSAEKAIDEAALRKAILKIQSDTSIDRKEKARLMQVTAKDFNQKAQINGANERVFIDYTVFNVTWFLTTAAFN